ncbi:MAG: DUF4275 family protein [Bacillales bacterium]|nr:DUF4275 family protein [Bacillales bacterium]
MTKDEFVRRFLETFYFDLTKKEFIEKMLSIDKNTKKSIIRQCYKAYKKHSYLWLGFSYKLPPCFEGNEARNEYDKVEKNGAFEIYYYVDNLCDDETQEISENHKTALQIDNSREAEFYIVGKDFSWCYVVTLDGDYCGPFFCYAPKK